MSAITNLTVAHEVATFLDAVKRRMPENQREILLDGEDATIGGTQGHVLMLLAQSGPLSNGELATALDVSPAAVTKAMRGLRLADPVLLSPVPDAHDARINRWTLTPMGVQLAAKHAAAHQETITAYADVLADFDAAELDTIDKFLTVMTSRLHV
ncbi:MarR family transcriptional regulator [Lacticaseibacillus songhuajiangensis]|jgi:DNA-binding MarR family transcriptional regulator|uniref:MarR family transcriptional regulator n=1 Tax=Lacticaseibacillus songhuajiangensis TaxID=1296539 RepID=UPI000F76791F|nr:MarR family transcriptional regulator [Lacticaseibacillus songhuajiangensis]